MLGAPRNFPIKFRISHPGKPDINYSTMLISRAKLSAFTLFNVILLVKSWEYNFPEAWQSQWTKNSQLNLGTDESCTTSHMTAFEAAKPGADIFLSTSPLDDFEA